MDNFRKFFRLLIGVIVLPIAFQANIYAQNSDTVIFNIAQEVTPTKVQEQEILDYLGNKAEGRRVVSRAWKVQTDHDTFFETLLLYRVLPGIRDEGSPLPDPAPLPGSMLAGTIIYEDRREPTKTLGFYNLAEYKDHISRGVSKVVYSYGDSQYDINLEVEYLLPKDQPCCPHGRANIHVYQGLH